MQLKSNHKDQSVIFPFTKVVVDLVWNLNANIL